MIDWGALRSWLNAKDGDESVVMALEVRVVAALSSELGRHLGTPAETSEVFGIRARHQILKGLEFARNFRANLGNLGSSSDYRGGRSEVITREPIVALTKVEYRASHEFAWEVQVLADFEVQPGETRSRVVGEFLPGQYRLTYTRGYEEGKAPSDIQELVFQEVTYQWRRRGAEDVASETAEGQSLKYKDRADIDKLRERVLKRWKIKAVVG